MKKFIFIILLIIGIYNGVKELPDGVSIKSEPQYISSDSIQFFADKTYTTDAGEVKTDQEIFDKAFSMMRNAQKYILVDMFLFNDYYGAEVKHTRELASEMTDILIAKKKDNPSIKIDVITDPINTLYGGVSSPEITRLRDAGIRVFVTNLGPLRDSNMFYSPIWRLFIQWFGNSHRGSMLPNPLKKDGYVTARTYLSLFNFKANHRKVIVADEKGNDGTFHMLTMITSANAHGASAGNGNTAIVVEGDIWRDAVSSENSVIQFSHNNAQPFEVASDTVAPTSKGDVKVVYITEGKIKDAVLSALRGVQKGDSIDMEMFYLSDRSIIDALVEASKKGVAIRLLLDPNKDAFGHEKNGIPNRPVATELIERSSGSIKIKWCDTHGEQCHTKLLLVHTGSTVRMIIGSANFTRRNIGDYNLETDLIITGKKNVPAIQKAQEYFDEQWGNAGGKHYSTSYNTYADTSWFSKALYRVQEFTGLSTF